MLTLFVHFLAYFDLAWSLIVANCPYAISCFVWKIERGAPAGCSAARASGGGSTAGWDRGAAGRRAGVVGACFGERVDLVGGHSVEVEIGDVFGILFYCLKQKRRPHTTLNSVGLRVIADERRLGLGNLHETILLDLGQGNVLLVPLKTGGLNGQIDK
jgi:hypothetical protein